MTNNLYNKLKYSKFINDSKIIDNINKATIGKKHIFTINDSNIAFLPENDFKNILIGALITANNQTRYIVSKDNSNNSVVLNSSVNWNNINKGYPFIFHNPIKQLLDKSNNIIGYITSNGQIFLSQDSQDLKINRLIASDESNSIKILNSNNQGLFIDSNGKIYYGSEDNWIELTQIDLSNFHIDGGTF